MSDSGEIGPDVPRVVTYELAYDMVGPGYMPGSVYRRKQLTVFRDGSRDWPAQTDEEAAEAVREFVNRPYVDAEVKVIRVTKVTTATAYEDVTETVLSGS